MATMPDTAIPLLEAKEITKSFPGTVAVDSVDFAVNVGEIHGLVGENGAGKSTLIKVIGGVHVPERGKIYLRGSEKRLRSYADARRAGIGVVYQELSVLPELTVAENISMGTWPRSKLGLIDWEATIQRCRKAMSEIGVDLQPDLLIGSLPMAQRQMVEIAKVVAADPDLVIFDEPTAALSKEEVGLLFRLLRELKGKGKGVVFISHRLDEVLSISDRITVMKDGKRVITDQAHSFSEDRLISSMVGRDFSEVFPQKLRERGDRAIFSCRGILKSSGREVALCVYPGEVVGVGGLAGQGQMDLLQSIFGLGGAESVRMSLDGTPLRVHNPVQAMKAGIGLIPENRSEEGVFLILSVLENLAAPTLERRKILGWIRGRDEKRKVATIVDELAIKLTSLNQNAQSLSGGNMQKLVLGKWLMFDPKVIVMLEPTKGVDVATKQQIYRLIRKLAEAGVAVILNTSDMLELIGLCDRVLIMNHGFMTAELRGEEITEEDIMKASVSAVELGESREGA
jgi:ABC-type sugar transport system ATPase subunit